jgi:hypothetical protein
MKHVLWKLMVKTIHIASMASDFRGEISGRDLPKNNTVTFCIHVSAVRITDVN